MSNAKREDTNRQGSVENVAEALYFLGAIAECEGRVEAAMSSYERAIRLAPDNVMCVQALRFLEESTVH